MTTAFTAIANKYQGVAPKQVISAVQSAAKKTGIDFSFLMEKAKVESSFNPQAKAKKSSATGLFQFIEQTWLSMVKKHGDKYGLGEYADKIEMVGGKACVNDCDIKEEILALRKNPEISALMAGEFSAENKAHLERNAHCEVGATELYMAHFMGANGATKFLNCKNVNGEACGADLFPKAAKANKNVFFDSETGKPRTLNEIYDVFANKFSTHSDGANPPSKTRATPSTLSAVSGSVSASARVPFPSPLDMAGRTLPVFDDADQSDDIIWSDDPRFAVGHKVPAGFGKISPANLMVLQDMQETIGSLKRAEAYRYNS